jgi:glycosyltransferase involved in cell wall biosynthesis
VVDDCSTDESLYVLDSFEKKLPQMRVFRNRMNLGVNNSVNLAISYATGEYVVCSAADDWLKPKFTEKMKIALAMFPDARLCISTYVEFFEEEGRTLVHSPRSERGCWYAGEGPSFISPNALRSLLRRSFVWLPISGALIHRATLLDIGGLDPALRWHADWFATSTIGLRHGFAVIPEPLSVFRVAPNTYSTTGISNPKDQRKICAAIYAKLRSPLFADIYRLMRQRPATLTPFIRYFVQNLASSPRDWAFLAAILSWWLNEVRKGRRPRRLREFLKVRGLLAPPN